MGNFSSQVERAQTDSEDIKLRVTRDTYFGIAKYVWFHFVGCILCVAAFELKFAT